jgi:PAS domain S-box-containing protein
MIRKSAAFLIRNFAVVCGGTTVLIGLAFFVGLAGGILGGSTIGSVCFVVLGAGLICYGRRISHLRPPGRLLAALVVVMAVLSGVQSSIHVWAAEGDMSWIEKWPALPKPMAIGTAIAFILGSLALLTSSESARRRRSAWSAWLGIGELVMALISLLAFLFGSQMLLSIDEQIRMGLQPAIAHLLLGVGILSLRPGDDFMRVFTADNVVGLFARRMIVVVLLLPPVLGLFRLYYLHYIELGDREGLAVFTVIYMLAGTLITLWAARMAGRLEEGREQAEDEQRRLLARLHEQAAGLQHQVATRTQELEEANLSLHAAVRINAQLSLVASHTTSGVIIADSQGKIEWVNKAWEHMSGYKLDEVVGRRPGQFLRGPETNAATARRFSESIRQGQSCYEEILNYAKDGRPYWQILDIEPVRNEAGTIVNFISVQTDITQYRESQQQLQGLTERLQLALHFSGFGVWEVDVQSGHMTWDARMFEIYGLNRDQFDGTRDSWRRWVHPDDLRLSEQKYTELISREAASYHIEFRITRSSDGSQRYLEAQGYLQRDESGRPLRVVGLNRDITLEHEQREQLHAYTERLQLALRASGYGVWDMDPVSGKIYWDARQCELYGLAADQFAGNYPAWMSLIHPEDREKVEANIQAAAESGDEFNNEFRIIRPDGVIRHIEDHGYLRRDAAGRLVRAVGMDRDVTAEKEMQEALRLAEERWQLALTGTNDGVWDWNVASGSIFFDVRYAEILGYPLEELPHDDRGWMVLVHPDDLSAAMAARESHLAGQTSLYSAEHRMRTKSGKWKWVLGRGKVVAWDTAGLPQRMVGTFSDITERKELEQTMRRNQELADHVGRLAMIGGWEYDLRDKTLYWSKSVRAIHEVTDDYVPQVETAHQFYAPEMRPVLQSAFHRCLTEGEPYDLELPLITFAGRRIWVRTLGRAEDSGGRRVRLYGAFQDITARHEAEEGRRQLETQLFQAQKMETLGTLAGGIAHDFNNLLTGIMGYHDLAADVLPEDHQVRGYLTEARQASMRARELVEQILTFSRQQETPERMPVDMALLVAEARRFLRATLPSTIQIQSEINEQCPRVLADSTQLHQVLLNLGSNGAQAMGDQGGVLKFTLSAVILDAPQAAALGGLSAGKYVCLCVSDVGHGIDETTLKRIFDPFFTTKKPGQGTGLGLSVVHGIVRSHQGGIEVDSKVGVGTTFRIYLPEADSETETRSQQHSSVPHGHGDKIFLVDDEEVVAKFAAIALERLGYKVVTFDSALPCLEAIRADPSICDVLVTDQTMPGLTGTNLIEAVHKINPGLRAILMSGYFTKVSAQTLDQLTNVELLNKPFTSDELALAVQRAVAMTGK